MVREDEIRIIAYALWVQDGCNHKNAVKHWLQAETIWEQNRKSARAPDQRETVSDKDVTAESDRPVNKSHFSHTECDMIVAPL
jgi:hypothetical protein